MFQIGTCLSVSFIFVFIAPFVAFPNQNELNSSNEYSLLDAETKDQLMEEMEGKDFNPEVWEKKLEDIITGGAGSDS